MNRACKITIGILSLFMAFMIGVVVTLFCVENIASKVSNDLQLQTIKLEVIEYKTIEQPKQNTTERQADQPNGYYEYFEITAYCPCEKCCGIWAKNREKDENGNDIVYTASGAIATPKQTIAVDPDVIPYGSEVIINGNTYIAQDCGSEIKGNRIDIYCSNHEEAAEFGKQYLEVFVIEK